jgi:hypothetical protein
MGAERVDDAAGAKEEDARVPEKIPGLDHRSRHALRPASQRSGAADNARRAAIIVEFQIAVAGIGAGGFDAKGDDCPIPRSLRA